MRTEIEAKFRKNLLPVEKFILLISRFMSKNDGRIYPIKIGKRSDPLNDIFKYNVEDCNSVVPYQIRIR